MKDVWKSTTTVNGEQSVMTTLTTKTLELSATVSLALGQFLLSCVSLLQAFLKARIFAVATSCCISVELCQWEKANFNPTAATFIDRSS